MNKQTIKPITLVAGAALAATLAAAPAQADVNPFGMSALASETPDLMILDVMMEEPDDGIRMARQIRRQGYDLPILMLTSVNVAMGLHIDKDAEMVPVDEFQEKPVDPDTLIAKVERLLGQGEEA